MAGGTAGANKVLFAAFSFSFFPWARPLSAETGPFFAWVDPEGDLLSDDKDRIMESCASVWSGWRRSGRREIVAWGWSCPTCATRRTW